VIPWLGRGFALGLLWGTIARLFMRLLADTPEFSWPGTLGILGVSGLMGAALGLVRAARVGGRRRWWRLAPLPTLVLFASPGTLLLPGVVATAAAARIPSAAVRWAVTAVGVGTTLGLATWLTWQDVSRLRPISAYLPGLSLMTLCALLAGLAWGEVFRNWSPAAGRAREARPAAVAAAG
jgi:hypothetical protein